MVFANDDPAMAEFLKETRALYDLKEAAFASGDIKPILNRFYSTDVISTDYEGITRVGTAGIRPLYEEVIDLYTVKVTSIYPNVRGDIGWDWANFEVFAKKPDVEGFVIKILFLWEKVDGEWICKGDIYVLGDFNAAPK